MRLASIAFTVFMLAGCAPYASYPPIENTAAVTDPTFEPVPTVITTAIEWARARESSSNEEPTSAFLLPVGTSNKAYEQIEERIPGSGTGGRERIGDRHQVGAGPRIPRERGRVRAPRGSITDALHPDAAVEAVPAMEGHR